MYFLVPGRISTFLNNTNCHIFHFIVKEALESDSGFNTNIVIHYLHNLGPLLNLSEPESPHLQKLTKLVCSWRILVRIKLHMQNDMALAGKSTGCCM